MAAICEVVKKCKTRRDTGMTSAYEREIAANLERAEQSIQAAQSFLKAIRSLLNR